ncbi:MAG: enoyl-CoA hydratase/isomerase family protein [Deltaproteobacteria bacterium]|nr:enoyl-CoA hydratase/isomerase family protein [Deltaproteobacteria bacterium]
MEGPGKLLRSADVIHGYTNTGIIYEWSRDKAYLAIDAVQYKGIQGAILYYHNPPLHQIGTTALYAFHEALDRVIGELKHLNYFILYGPNDPVHTGGDLKESLGKLQESLQEKEEMRLSGASAHEMDKLFSWGEARLKKGIVLYHRIRTMARHARVLGVCGGGLRFGGSAEIQLMCDVLLGDSRSGMCFSEAMIGIIPGWAGMARVLTKAGLENAEYMTKTARVVHAQKLKEIGIYNDVATVNLPFPKKIDGNNQDYQLLLEEHDYNTGLVLLPRALELATCEKAEIPSVHRKNCKLLASRKDIAIEVKTRMNPDNYTHIRNKRLRDVQREIGRLGRPLAPQSIAALEGLLKILETAPYDEENFVQEELKADAALYRDPKFIEGLIAMLAQRVPDFREP